MKNETKNPPNCFHCHRKINKMKELYAVCAAFNFFDMLTFVTQIQIDYEQCFCYFSTSNTHGSHWCDCLLLLFSAIFLYMPSNSTHTKHIRIIRTILHIHTFCHFVDRIIPQNKFDEWNFGGNVKRKQTNLSSAALFDVTSTDTNTREYRIKSSQLFFSLFLQILTITVFHWNINKTQIQSHWVSPSLALYLVQCTVSM